MYKLVFLLSYFLRFCLGPNPFKYLPNGEGLNLIFGGVLAFITWIMVGIFYRKGSEPVFGAIAFLAMYFINGFIFQYILKFYPMWWLIIVSSIVYVVLYIYLVNKLFLSN